MCDKLTIAIDFDDTFTADPTLWVEFIRKADKYGHRVIMVTARRRTDENEETVHNYLRDWDCPLPVIFTDLGSKLHAVEKRGIKVNIWIDDDPTSLVNGR